MDDIIPFNRSTEKDFSILSGHAIFDINQNRTRFDSAGAKLMGASPGMKLHFIPIGELEIFVVVNNDKDGYKLHQDGNLGKGLAASTTLFVRWFFSRWNIKQTCLKCSLTLAQGKEWRGCKMFKIEVII